MRRTGAMRNRLATKAASVSVGVAGRVAAGDVIVEEGRRLVDEDIADQVNRQRYIGAGEGLFGGGAATASLIV